MSKTLIIPGLEGSPAPHWQHWWAHTDPSARLVEQADWSRPQPESWETEIAGAILQHPGSILVGHSLGAIAIVRILARWPQLNVAGALLVAPAEPSNDSRIARFGPIFTQPLRVPTTVVASRNDPWMTFTRAAQLAKAWGGDMVDMGFAGHINVDSGFGPWQRGLTLRDELRDQHALQITQTSPPLYQRLGWAF